MKSSLVKELLIAYCCIHDASFDASIWPAVTGPGSFP